MCTYRATARAPGYHTHVAPETRTTRRRGEDRASVQEDVGQSLARCLLGHFLTARDHDAAHLWMHLLTLEDLRYLAQVANAAICTGADHHLLDWHIGDLFRRIGVRGQVGQRHDRFQVRDVDLDDFLVARVSVAKDRLIGVIGVLGQPVARHVVEWEDS
jgi:hypothetical protein